MAETAHLLSASRPTAVRRSTHSFSCSNPRIWQQDGEYEDDGDLVDDAEIEQLKAEQDTRLHARMAQERDAGNQMTDDQLEAFVKERRVPTRALPRTHASLEPYAPARSDCSHTHAHVTNHHKIITF